MIEVQNSTCDRAELGDLLAPTMKRLVDQYQKQSRTSMPEISIHPPDIMTAEKSLVDTNKGNPNRLIALAVALVVILLIAIAIIIFRPFGGDDDSENVAAAMTTATSNGGDNGGDGTKGTKG